MEQIAFEKLCEADYARVADIYNYYVLNSTATYHVAELSADAVIRYFEIGLATTYAYRILSGSEMVGFCLLRRYSDKEGYRYTSEITVYIDPDNTNKGIGAETVRYLDAVAKAKGIRTVVAAICAENTASIRLFEACNYTRCGYFKKMGNKFGRDLDNVYYQKLV